jgi:adenine-specific DNA-methyltransferase
MQVGAYFEMKQRYAHEAAIVPKGEAGTVYTPSLLQRDMIFMMIHAHVKRNRPMDEAIFYILWNIYNNESTTPDVILSDSQLKAARAFTAWLLKQRILDPCCGSGMLLLAYLEWLAFLLSHFGKLKSLTLFLSQKLYATDINAEAINVFRQLLALFSAAYAFDLPEVLNVKIGNSLLMPLEPVDLIIGNPPYIGEKGHISIFEPVRQTAFGAQYYEGKMDYFYFFVYRGCEALAPGGTLCYLTSNYFYTADGAKKLRHFLKTRFYLQSMLNFEGRNVFQSRGLHACIYTIGDQKPECIDVYETIDRAPNLIRYDSAFNEREQLQFIASDTANAILAKIRASQIGVLSDYYVVKQGIVSGADRSKTHGGIFVLSHSEAADVSDDMREWLRPFYKNSQIKHFHTERQPDFMLYYLDAKAVTVQVPQGIYDHLSPYRTLLERRREVRNGVRNWYQLTWPREESIFKGPKIVAPQRCDTNVFAYNEIDFYASADVYYIKEAFSTQQSESPLYTLRVLALILNSNVVRFWLYLQGKRKGSLLELYATPLKAIPMICLSPEAYQTLDVLSNSVYVQHSYSAADIIQRVDAVLFEAIGLTDGEITYIQGSVYENHH